MWNCPRPASFTEYDVEGANQTGGDRNAQRQKVVRSLRIDDRNLFITEICMSCKSKEVLKMKTRRVLIRIVMISRLWSLLN